MSTVLADFEQLFALGKYEEAISAASAFSGADSQRYATIGISLLRLGNFSEAENYLESAILLGHKEASVEYGNWLRINGRFEDAEAHFSTILPDLTGELNFRALRWMGVVYYQTNKFKEALKILEKARKGYSLIGDKLGEAKVSQNLVAIYNDIGEYKKAKKLLETALIHFREFNSKGLLVQAIYNLITINFTLNHLDDALYLINELDTIAGTGKSMIHIYVWMSRATFIERVGGNRNDYIELINKIIDTSEGIGDYEHLVWALVKKVEFLLQSDNTREAMRLVYQAPQDENGQFPIPVRIVRAMINRRMGNLPEAVDELRAVAQDLEAAGNVAELARVRLQLAYALHLSGQPDDSADVLRAALQGLLRTNIHPSMRPELEELSELLHFAAMEPSLAPYLEPVMDSLAGVLGGDSSGDDEQVRLQVHTLGRVSILRGGDPVTFQLKGTVPLLVYLALTPNRTRQEIQNDLYPDKEPDAASSYVRKSIQELRELLGHNAVLTEGPRNHSRYRLGPGLQIDLDLTRFQEAVGSVDMARALALYRGEFLPGVDESEWVAQKREEARLALTFELHNQIVEKREKNEHRRVILLANQYLRVDPYEMEVHEMRVAAARKVGTATELGRYVAAMNSTTN